MVSSSLLLLLLGFMAPLFARTSKLVKRADQDATAQQEALASVRRLFSEAAYSHSRTLRVINQDSTLCAFLSTRPPRHPNTPGLAAADFVSLGMFTTDLVWRKMLLIYFQSNQRQLCSKEFSYTSPDQELIRVKSDRLQALVYRADVPTVVVARVITSFFLETPQDGMLLARVRAERRWDKNFISQLELVVSVRNR